MIVHQRQYVGRIFWLSISASLHIEGSRNIAGKPVSIVHSTMSSSYLSTINKALIVGLGEACLVDEVPLATSYRLLVVVAIVSPAEKLASCVCPILDERVPGIVVVRLATV